MRFLLIMLLASALPAAALSPAEAEVLRLLNEARTAPAAFANSYLRERMPAGAECAREMRRLKPMRRLQTAQMLERSAIAHALDTGRAGVTGHVGTNGSTLADRIERHGQWQGSIAENIYYGPGSPLEIVLSLLIDRGVAGRGHRRNILDPNLAYVGIATRLHRSYGNLCVMDFASAVQ